MGVGKTLMCLALICATIQQPCLPPVDTANVSQITTSTRIDHYPFAADVELRRQVRAPEPRTYRRPGLVEMCADILAIVDPSALQHPSVPPNVGHNYLRFPLYYDFPPEDQCQRAAKRKTVLGSLRRVYLAKTTLIVVPAILVPQWKAEMEKHVIKGALTLCLVDKEMPEVETLMAHDVSRPNGRH